MTPFKRRFPILIIVRGHPLPPTSRPSERQRRWRIRACFSRYSASLATAPKQNAINKAVKIEDRDAPDEETGISRDNLPYLFRIANSQGQTGSLPPLFTAVTVMFHRSRSKTPWLAPGRERERERPRCLSANYVQTSHPEGQLVFGEPNSPRGKLSKDTHTHAHKERTFKKFLSRIFCYP